MKARIIEQAVERVDHPMAPEQLTTLGNEIESAVLNGAIQWHAEANEISKPGNCRGRSIREVRERHTN